MKNNLCLFCGSPVHVAADCNKRKRSEARGRVAKAEGTSGSSPRSGSDSKESKKE